jgi:hypothetical protein
MSGAIQHVTPVTRYARAAGVMFLLTMIFGGIGEFYVPSKLIVTGDAQATAQNIVSNMALFRFSFVSYLIEATCDIGLAWALFVILKPVRRNVALLAAFFGLVSTAVFAGGELFYFGATFILGGADYMKAFTPDQVNSLALLSLKFYGACAAAFMGLYGIAALIRGYLIYKSDFLPRILGVLLMIAGSGFVLKNITYVLAPRFSSDLFVIPMSLAGLALTVWFLARGVDAIRWNEMADRAA